MNPSHLHKLLARLRIAKDKNSRFLSARSELLSDPISQAGVHRHDPRLARAKPPALLEITPDAAGVELDLDQQQMLGVPHHQVAEAKPGPSRRPH
jgi:hypothetical protein